MNDFFVRRKNSYNDDCNLIRMFLIFDIFATKFVDGINIPTGMRSMFCLRRHSLYFHYSAWGHSELQRISCYCINSFYSFIPNVVPSIEFYLVWCTTQSPEIYFYVFFSGKLPTHIHTLSKTKLIISEEVDWTFPYIRILMIFGDITLNKLICLPEVNKCYIVFIGTENIDIFVVLYYDWTFLNFIDDYWRVGSVWGANAKILGWWLRLHSLLWWRIYVNQTVKT